MSEHDSFFDELEQAMNTDLANEGSAAMPRADLWQQIRADYDRQSMKRESTMSTTTAPTFDQVVPMPSPVSGRSMGQYLNAAASIALVLAVAIGGWFATMQLNTPNGSDGAFGLLGQSDATCDAEPMTVDEVMAIVENPYRYLDGEAVPHESGSNLDESPWLAEYQEVQPRLPVSLNVGLNTPPTQTAFDQASDVIEDYVNCLAYDNSVAMMLRFSDPFSIQHHVRMEFPFYRTEEQVRAFVTDWLDDGETSLELTHEREGKTYIYRPTKDRSIAGSQIHEFGLGFDQVIYIGSDIYDENGNHLTAFHPTLYMTYNVDQEFLDNGVVFILLHSRYSGDWYVVTEDWMNLDDVI